MTYKEHSILFWDQFFKDQKPVIINQSDFKIQTTLDTYLKQIGDQCERVLDIGCGLGTCLMTSISLGQKMKEGIGFDTSEHAIHFAQETSKLSNIKGLSFHVKDEQFLSSFPHDYFDGILCSNFLDVISYDMSEVIIKEIKNILKPNGLLLLKLNFYLDEALIQTYKMEQAETNTYLMHGVLRSYNLTTDAWIKRLSGFEVLSIDGYQRKEGMPLDRIILLKRQENREL